MSQKKDKCVFNKSWLTDERFSPCIAEEIKVKSMFQFSFKRL